MMDDKLNEICKLADKYAGLVFRNNMDYGERDSLIKKRLKKKKRRKNEKG